MPVAESEQAVRRPDEALRTVTDAAAIETEWRELAAATPGLSYFATPDWILGWWETLGRRATGHVGIWRDPSGALEAVVPMGVVRHRWHPRIPVSMPVWTNLGSGPGAADHHGFAMRPGMAPSVRAWLTALATRRPMILADLDPDHGAAVAPPGARQVGTSECPRIGISTTTEPASGGSAKFRKQLRAYRRKATAADVTFRWIPPQDMTSRIVATVIDLHGQRARQAGWATTFTAERIDLHAALVDRAGPGRGPAVVLAEMGDRPVAALYGFRWADVFAYYQIGWTEELAAANLATVLVAEAIEHAAADGATVFDFLRGADGYKYRFGATDRTDVTLVAGAGPTGALLRAKLGQRARSRQRRNADEETTP